MADNELIEQGDTLQRVDTQEPLIGEQQVPKSTLRTLAQARALPQADGGVMCEAADVDAIVAFKDADGRTMLVVWDPSTGALAKTPRVEG